MRHYIPFVDPEGTYGTETYILNREKSIEDIQKKKGTTGFSNILGSNT